MKKLLLITVCSIVCTTYGHTFLVFGGKTGWIGQKIVALLKNAGHTPICAQSRLEQYESILQEIDSVHPAYIINAAGITGRPNIDWCEDHRQETIMTNLIGAINIIDAAHHKGIHITTISTGCIYLYDEQHPRASGIGFTEEEKPNFTGSFYSRMKVRFEELAQEYPNSLVLRVKMPISRELNKGFLGKILGYKKVVNIPNSFSVLDDLLPIAIDMALKKITGVFNFVNPGVLSHNQVLELYKKYINPDFVYHNFTEEEQAQILKVPRANAELNVEKLLALYPDIPHIEISLTRLFQEIAAEVK